jgi:Zn-dependent M28 family amino/carboxypeptidase
VTHPREGVSIKQIKFVFNLDLMGSGEDGATIVNGAIFKKEFDLLVKINEENQYLSKIKARGKAANSDHYFFTELGVHSFFIYLMGGYTYYHVPLDNPDNLILGDPYDRAFMLIRDFVIAINELN